MTLSKEAFAELSGQAADKQLIAGMTPEILTFFAPRWNLLEKIDNWRRGITSGGNPAGLTPEESFIWALQVSLCQASDEFAAKGRYEAKLAREAAHSFYTEKGDNPHFCSAVEKIGKLVMSTRPQK